MSSVDPDFWRDRRVLLTGHTGFKGAWLSLWLGSLGARVTGFSAGAPARDSLFAQAGVDRDVQGIAGDVRDPAAVDAAMAAAEPEIVIHMAAQALVRRSIAQPRETFEANVMGTVNVLEAVRRRGESVRAVVCVTSDKCYENREQAEGYVEDDPLGGRDPYSSSKACAELVTQAYRRTFFADGRLATARAGNVIGGGDWAQDRLVPDIMRAALTDGEVRVRNPESVRPWQHVLNPLCGYLVLAQALWHSGEHASAWNFGPAEEEARSVRWVLERVGELWPGQLRWSLPDRGAPQEARTLQIDSSRARAELGWRPAVDLQAALQSTVDWYLRFRERADMRAVTLGQIEALDHAGAPSSVHDAS